MIKTVVGQLNCDMIMFCKKHFSGHYSTPELSNMKVVNIFRFWSDAELNSWEPALKLVFFAAGLNSSVKRLRIVRFFAAASIFEIHILVFTDIEVISPRDKAL